MLRGPDVATCSISQLLVPASNPVLWTGGCHRLVIASSNPCTNLPQITPAKVEWRECEFHLRIAGAYAGTVRRSSQRYAIIGLETLKTKTAASTKVTMSELMTPQHANYLGNVFGGHILALMDKVAYVTASRFAETVCVTAAFDRVDFLSPIAVGELVHMTGSVDHVGTSSIQVRIEVRAESVQKSEVRDTNTCIVTMVAIDENGKPTPAPRLACETREEKERFLAGAFRKNFVREQKSSYRTLLEELSALTNEEIAERYEEVTASRP